MQLQVLSSIINLHTLLSLF